MLMAYLLMQVLQVASLSLASSSSRCRAWLDAPSPALCACDGFLRRCCAARSFDYPISVLTIDLIDSPPKSPSAAYSLRCRLFPRRSCSRLLVYYLFVRRHARRCSRVAPEIYYPFVKSCSCRHTHAALTAICFACRRRSRPSGSCPSCRCCFRSQVYYPFAGFHACRCCRITSEIYYPFIEACSRRRRHAALTAVWLAHARARARRRRCRSLGSWRSAAGDGDVDGFLHAAHACHGLGRHAAACARRASVGSQ